MTDRSIYRDIALRTGGDIYLGVVGPVRSGKSTFIKKFAEALILPNSPSDFSKERMIDELPQSAAGRTIMTTEPKFVPETAAEIVLEEQVRLRVRLVDCVGYIVPSSLGYIENSEPRMVKTPWFDEEIPFNMAAEIGTKKVITEHATVGVVVTTDGSISEIPRAEYEEAEERVIAELKEIRKPFVVLLNCMYPQSAAAAELARVLSEKYGVAVVPVNCLRLTEEEIRGVLAEVLYEFPVKRISVDLPGWIAGLPCDDPLKTGLLEQAAAVGASVERLRQLGAFNEALAGAGPVLSVVTQNVELGEGAAEVKAELDPAAFYEMVSGVAQTEIADDVSLVETLRSLAAVNREYRRLSAALEQVNSVGYGIVMPSIGELTLEEPEIVRQGSRYGVRLRASAPSIHMLRADIKTEVAPIVGSEKQSEDLVKYLLEGFRDDPSKIWESNIFGKSLDDLVNEGLKAKLNHMPNEARMKLQQTLERVINEGCNGLICIII